MNDVADRVRAACASSPFLTDHPGVALRLMLAFTMAGSPLWNVQPERTQSRDEASQESVETSAAETAFDERRRAVLALLGSPRARTARSRASSRP